MKKGECPFIVRKESGKLFDQRQHARLIVRLQLQIACGETTQLVIAILWGARITAALERRLKVFL